MGFSQPDNETGTPSARRVYRQRRMVCKDSVFFPSTPPATKRAARSAALITGQPCGGSSYLSHNVYSPSIQRHSGQTDLTVLTAQSVQYSANSATLFAVFRRNIWSLIKAVGIGLVIALVLVEIYARFWFICAVDDLCCAANTPWR